MKFSIQTPKQALKALLKQAPLRSEIDVFKAELITLLNYIDAKESEEFHKNLFSDFLKKFIYKDDYFINTKGRQDLVIHNGKDNKTSVGVIIEAKKPSNKADWFTAEKPNAKALQELVLYYLRERIEANNIDLKYLVATNIHEYYIIDVIYFEKLFYKNKALVKQYEEWRDGKKVSKNTDLFYNEIAKPFIDSLTEEVPCTYFDIRDYEKILRDNNTEDDNELIALFKILSPTYLLKVAEANDSNALNAEFYRELLHIIGLEEEKEGGKNIIRRKKDKRNAGSFLEQAIQALTTEGLHKVSHLSIYGENKQYQFFSIALELCITWINRVLFLKLLEGQLVSYHKSNKAYRFLNSEMISDFDELFKLFHRVLAVNLHERTGNITTKYSKVPYLNSSLFEISELEDQTIKISSLDNGEALEIFGTSILKEDKKKVDKLPTLTYFLKFLEAYDFGAEGKTDIREDSKPIINASVLGKVFEKINGYKDGSIFTPAFITMYMCKESIRLAVVQKFNETKGWKCENFAELYNKITDRKEANQLINSLKICDPAVGSGHFLVSALNEMIAIKSELDLLEDEQGKRLKNTNIEVVNDELLITDEDGSIFTYNFKHKESQRIQKTLFHEKQHLIENCLFGVDINPNSVKICRLRLWIELLKNTYYTEESDFTALETLPNIDINIKCGNSLVSRYDLTTDLSRVLKNAKYDIEQYRGFVNSYKNEKQRDSKKDLEKIIAGIKSSFRTEIAKYSDPRILRLQKVNAELILRASDDLFNKGIDKKQGNGEGNGLERDKIKKLEEEKEHLTQALEETQNNTIYQNAFEWRFEFPEVLNNNGDFEGFDVVISNPPYIQHRELAHISSYLKENYEVYSGTSDISSYFFEKFAAISLPKGIIAVINSNKFFNTEYGKKLRDFLAKYNLHSIINLEQVRVFSEALVSSAILIIDKGAKRENFSYLQFFKEKVDDLPNLSVASRRQSTQLNQEVLLANAWLFNNAESNALIDKIKSKGQTLSEISDIVIHRGITTGFDDAFIIDNNTYNSFIKQNPHADHILKKLLKGEDINRYKINYRGLRLIHSHNGIKNVEDSINLSKNFPLIYQYIDEINAKTNGRVENRIDKGKHWTNLRSCAFVPDFNKTKIIWGLISGNWSFALDNKLGYFLTSASYFLISKKIPLKFILALFNSKLFNYYFIKVGEYTAGGAYVLKKTSVEKFIIPQADEKSQKALIKLVDTILTKKAKEEDTQEEEDKIDKLVYQLYDLSQSEIEIIEQSLKKS
ncbi:MAG: class I SAM-dependent DNA methyltransferase [Cytophagales bacterium]|nr:MAG: class I SAM-dependent DNA methyltransferase [Cytophagales bacterium]